MDLKKEEKDALTKLDRPLLQVTTTFFF